MLIAQHSGSQGSDASNTGSKGTETRTSERVQQLLAEDGPLSASDLAERLGVTPAAVRRHLDQLAEKGAVKERELATIGSRGRGRPARTYILSDSGHGAMGGDYVDVATSALRFLAEHAGVNAVGQFARERGATLERRHATQLPSTGADTRARAEALASVLSAEGFAASIRLRDEGRPAAGLQLRQGHCPVLHVASEFPVFCEVEADAFSRLLGVTVERQTTRVRGEHVCTTFIPLDAAPLPVSSGANEVEASSTP